MNSFKLGKKKISNISPTYFIADIAANHDGSLSRAKKLIELSAKAGANAAKFQHFKAETIVSKLGFDKMKKKAHQAKWKKSVFEVYKEASINPEWTKELKKTCIKNNIDFMTAPYDLNYIDQLQKHIMAFKIGSGDITWEEALNKFSKKKVPIILATGASYLSEVKRAVKLLTRNNNKIILMQCNTNYTNSIENFKYLNLNVLSSYKKLFKNKVILGLSDHTPGHVSVLGAVTLGAKVIEKHFTDDNKRNGPDHKFSMNPQTWKEMVSSTRILEAALGSGKKIIENNEKESAIVQRRAIWVVNKINKNQIIKKNNLICLRPCPSGALDPFYLKKIIGKRAKKKLIPGNFITKLCVKS